MVVFSLDFDNWPLGVLTEAIIKAQIPSGVDVKFLNGNQEIVNFGSGRALQLKVPANTYGFTKGSRWLYRFSQATGNVYDELYFRYKLRIQAPFDPVLGGKLPIACWGSKIPDAKTTPKDGDGWSDILMWKQGGVNKGSGNQNNSPAQEKFELKHFTYAISNAESPYVTNGYADSRFFLDEATQDRYEYDSATTYDIVRRIKMNTPGQANGIMETWVDGLKVHSFSGYEFRGVNSPNEGIHGFGFTLFRGGNTSDFQDDADMLVIVDDLSISTTNPLSATAVETPTLVSCGNLSSNSVEIMGGYSVPNGNELIVVEQSSDGSTWSQVASFPATQSWAYLAQNLLPDTRYYFRAKAVDGNGVLADSSYSNGLECVTKSIATAPAAFVLEYSTDGGTNWTEQAIGDNSISVGQGTYNSNGFRVRTRHVSTGCTSATTILDFPTVKAQAVLTLDITGGPDALILDGTQSRNFAGEIVGGTDTNAFFRWTFTLENEADRPSVVLLSTIGNAWIQAELAALAAQIGITWTPPGVGDGTITGFAKNTGASAAFAHPVRVSLEYDPTGEIDPNGYSPVAEVVIPTFHVVTGEPESKAIAQVTEASALPIWPVGGISYVSGPMADIYDGAKYSGSGVTTGNYEVFEYQLLKDRQPVTGVAEDISPTGGTQLRTKIQDWVEEKLLFNFNYTDDPRFTDGVERNGWYYNTAAEAPGDEVEGKELYALIRNTATGEWFKIVFFTDNIYTR